MGYEYLSEMLQAQRDDEDAPEIDPEDLPPVLDWEQEAYDVYEMVQTQWVYTMAGRAAFDHAAAIKIAERRGLNLDLFQELLRAIEYAVLRCDAEDREERAAKQERK